MFAPAIVHSYSEIPLWFCWNSVSAIGYAIIGTFILPRSFDSIRRTFFWSRIPLALSIWGTPGTLVMAVVLVASLIVCGLSWYFDEVCKLYNQDMLGD